jgi:phosphatidylethanolamine-binding protein (PEBP) family uncharacterized protein
MQITSAAIENSKIKMVHACKGKGGENLPPPIKVSGIPSGTTHLAIIIDDSKRKIVYWNVFNILFKGKEYSIEAGGGTNGSIGKSSGKEGYFGFCSKNKIRFAVFAMNKRIKAASGGFGTPAYSIENFEQKFKTRIIGKAVTNEKLQ